MIGPHPTILCAYKDSLVSQSFMFSTSNRVFSSKRKQTQYSVISQWKKSISIITYLCNYITIHCSFWVWIIDQDVSWRYIVIVWLRLLLNVQCTFRIIFRHSVFLYSINRLTKIESIFARRSWKLTMRMLLVFTA